MSDKPVIQQIVRRKSQTKSTPATTESDKEEEEEEDDDEEDTPRKHVTRSSSAKTKRGSLLGIQKGTESDSENNGKGNFFFILDDEAEIDQRELLKMRMMAGVPNS